MVLLLIIPLSLLSLSLLILGPWPALELIRGYLTFFVSAQFVLAIALLKRFKKNRENRTTSFAFASYLIISCGVAGVVIKALITQRPQVDPNLLIVQSTDFSQQAKINFLLDSKNEMAVRGHSPQVLAVNLRLHDTSVLGSFSASYKTRLSLPELGLELFFKGNAEFLSPELGSLVRGVGPKEPEQAYLSTPSRVFKSEGGLIKFKLVPSEDRSDLSTSSIISNGNGYLAFLRLPNSNSLVNLRESKAYLRRLGALVRHLEGPIIILLNSDLNVFHRQIPYLEKVGRVKMASTSVNNSFVLFPHQNLLVFKK